MQFQLPFADVIAEVKSKILCKWQCNLKEKNNIEPSPQIVEVTLYRTSLATEPSG